MVRQLDVCRHPIPARRDIYPYLIILQHDDYRVGADLIAAPLAVPTRAFASRLQPPLEVESHTVLLMTHELSPIPMRLLERPMTSLTASRDRIIAAIDLLLAGS